MREHEQLSAILEAYKSLLSTVSSTTPTRELKHVHAEHHSSHLLPALRTTFALDIPSDAAPVYQVRVGQDVPGDLDWPNVAFLATLFEC
ncbi:hypothetical protein H2248_000095 [Termitomyces sp. 'cryptogamus']|nr:hypothetical protein H2248_000095 [Termitomyces sp. 'cryptogamus']